MNNMEQMIKQAQKMQQEMMRNQKELEKKEFSGVAGGDMVHVTVSGKKEVKNIRLSKEVVDPKDIEMLQDLIVSATNSALQKAGDEANIGLKHLTQGMNLPPGLSL